MLDASVTALRGTIVSFTGDPFLAGPVSTVHHEPDGLILCRDGLIEAIGAYDSVRSNFPCNISITDHSGCILSASFVDTHALCADRDDCVARQAAFAENRKEVAFVTRLFPERKDFLDICDHCSLVSRRTVIGHAFGSPIPS